MKINIPGHNTTETFPDDATPEHIRSTLARKYPPTGQQVRAKLKDPATPWDKVSLSEFREYRLTESDITFSEGAGLALNGLVEIVSEVGRGIKAGGDELSKGNKAAAAASTLEGAARGTLELGTLAAKVVNYVGESIVPGDDEKAAFLRFLGLKKLDNLTSAAREGDQNLLSSMLMEVPVDKDLANAMAGTMDKLINQDLAKGLSNVLDPSMLVGLPGVKLLGGISRGVGKAIETTGGAVSAGGRLGNSGLRALKDSVVKARNVAEEAAPGFGSSRVTAGIAGAAGLAASSPVAFTAAKLAALPTAMELGGGAMEGIGRAMQHTPTRVGAFRGLATSQPGTVAGKAAGRLTFLDTPIDYAGAVASGVVAGSVVGGVLGGLAEGEEGFYSGIGSGAGLGGVGAGVARTYQGLSGAHSKAAAKADWERFFTKEEPELKAWANKVAKTPDQKAQMMDLLSVILKGSDVKIKARDKAWFEENGKGSQAAYATVEGDSPSIVINSDNATFDRLPHETIHALGKLEGYGEYVQDVMKELGENFGPESDRILAKYRAKLEKGFNGNQKKMAAWDNLPHKEKLEEVAAEYFSAFIRGEHPDFILKGTRSRIPGATSALNLFDAITKRATSRKLRRITAALERKLYGDSLQSEIVGEMPRSSQIDRLYREMVKARRRSYKATALASDKEVKAYVTKDLADDELFAELKEQGLAFEKNGKRTIGSPSKIKRAQKERSARIIEVLDKLGASEDTPSKDKPTKDKPSHRLTKAEDGGYVGTFYSPAQINALEAAGVISSRRAEKLRSIGEAIEAGNILNVTYAAATSKKRGSKKADGEYTLISKYDSRIPVSNRDTVPMFTSVTKAGNNNVKFLDWSQLLSKAAEAHGRDGSAVAKLWKSQSALETDLARYLDALQAGTKPTADIFGVAKRDQLNKLVEARNTRGNPELPVGGRYNHSGNLWKDFRLDRIEAMEARAESVRFSDPAYKKAQDNFSPAAEGRSMDSDVPFSRAANGAMSEGPGIIRFSPMAYHGTPHKVDEFSNESIGTGEGNQAYGWGLYFTDTKAIAKGYMDNLSDYGSITVGGVEKKVPLWDPNMSAEDIVIRTVADRLLNTLLSEPRAIESAEKRLRDDAASKFGAAKKKEALQVFLKWKQEGITAAAGGNLYKVNLKVNDDQMLHWDKAIGEHSKSVQDALAKIDPDQYKPGSDDYDANERGQVVYMRLWQDKITKDRVAEPAKVKQMKASKELLKSGIKGIKYADQISRGDVDSESYNYVVFNDADIEIVRDSGETDVSFSPAKDQEYIKAIDSGDTTTAQRMVSEAATAAGYKAAAYHGSPDLNPINNENTFKTKTEQYSGKRSEEDAYFFTDNHSVAKSYTDERRAFDYQSADGGVKSVYLDLGRSKVINGKGKKWERMTQQSVRDAKAEGYDSYVVEQTRDEYMPGKLKATVYAVFSPQQIKSAELSTYDATGALVPLSKRFNSGTSDIRFSPEADKIWDTSEQKSEQEFGSARTADGNKYRSPSTLGRIKWEKDTVNADIGGGPHPHFTKALKKKGVTNHVFDPYNRSKEHNDLSAAAIRGGQADTVTANNVLNVIKEGGARDKLIAQAADALKPDGTAYFLIHQGDGKGNSKKTGPDSWQEYTKPETYIPEISKHFDSIKRRANLIEARDPIKATKQDSSFSPAARTSIDVMNDPSIALKELPEKTLLRDIVEFFSNRSAKEGKLSDFTDENAKKLGDALFDEATEALSKDQDAIGWYDRKIDEAIRYLHALHPELASDLGLDSLFKAFLAVTSNGQDIRANFNRGEELYDHYKKTGEIITDSKWGGKSSLAINKGLKLIESVVSDLGLEGARNFMLSELKVKDLNKVLEKYGVDGLNGELNDYKVLGSMMLGPKIGSFYGNMNKRFDSTTMDRWFMRTVNRMRGVVMDVSAAGIDNQIVRLTGELKGKRGVAEIRKGLAGYRKAVKSGETDIKAFPELYDYVKKTYNAISARNFANRTEIEKAAQRLYVNATKINEAPKGGGERAWIRKSIEHTQSRLRKAGINISNADLQAVLWYWEKDLYGKLGVGNKRSARADYADAARELYEQNRPRAGGRGADASAADSGIATGTPEGDVGRPSQSSFSPAKSTSERHQGEVSFSPAAPQTPEFRQWFGDSKVIDEGGGPKVVFHGTARPDRLGSKFKKSRATSGPMSFFTDKPEVASNYSTSKPDTSLGDVEPTESFHKGRTKGLRNIYWSLSQRAREKLGKIGPRIGQNEDTGNIELKPSGSGLVDKSHYDYTLREHGGNPIMALHDIWVMSGTLFGEEGRFTKVLKMAGADGVKYDDPHGSYSGVYPVFLSLENPINTSSIPGHVVEALEKASKRVRKPRQQYGADSWDKNSRYSAREWVDALKEDLDTGKNSYVWTSIPDWVTKTLKAQGFDGIADEGGKGGGMGHTVYIPFEPEQIKSAIANKGSYSQSSPDIRFSPTRPLNKRGGMLYNTESGHRAIQLSDRSKIRIYGPAGKRIGLLYDDIDAANEAIQFSF